MCRNCGALVSAGESSCAQCGRPVQKNADVPQYEAPPYLYDRESMRFARAVLGRPYIFTIIFLVANFFVFLLMWTESGLGRFPIVEPFSYPVLMAFGAKLNSSISAGHQYWRFVTPVFIHVNLAHLLVNMYSLWIVGPYVEKLYGAAKFVVFWVLTGVAGIFASYLTVRPDLHVNSVGRFLFKAADMPSAGASGALFGLVGVLFVFGIKFRRELPEGFKRAFGTGLLPMIMINLFIGYLGRGFIDNAAHLGGFAAGAALALMVGYERPGERSPMRVIWHALQVCALALVAVSFLMAARSFPAQLPKTEETAGALPGTGLNGPAADFAANLDAVNDAQRAFIKAFDEGDASDIDAALKRLDAAPQLDDETSALRDDLKPLLMRARDYAGAAPEKLRNKRARLKESAAILSDFQAWQERYEKWTANESEKRGLKLIKEEPSPQKSPGGK